MANETGEQGSDYGHVPAKATGIGLHIEIVRSHVPDYTDDTRHLQPGKMRVRPDRVMFLTDPKGMGPHEMFETP